MTVAEFAAYISDVEDLVGDFSDEQIAELKSALVSSDEEKSVPVSSKEEKSVTKIKCKVCGFQKKPRKVLRETGICGVCTEAVKSGSEDGVEVVGRMGKRGRSTVSVVIDGQRFRVKRLSSKHSEAVAAKHASKAKGYAKRGKRTGNAPKGLPTCSRVGEDAVQRTHEQGSLFAS